MNVTEFAKYVVDNMGRATIGNALNISSKFNSTESYNLNEFINAMDAYLGDCIARGAIDRMVAYKMLIAANKCQTMFNRKDEFKYNVNMLIDTFIIELWEAVNKK